jgi:hypothetical protein
LTSDVYTWLQVAHRPADKLGGTDAMQEPSAQTDIGRRRSLAAIAAWIVFVLLAIVAMALLFYWLWSLSDRLDKDAERRGLTPQLMQRKTTAMLAIRDGLAAGDVDRAQEAAALLRQISETSRWYLPDRSYAALSDDFRDALRDLDNALRDRDAARLRATYDQLAESCIECHRKASKDRINLESIQFLHRSSRQSQLMGDKMPGR